MRGFLQLMYDATSIRKSFKSYKSPFRQKYAAINAPRWYAVEVIATTQQVGGKLQRSPTGWG